ncbi:MAG: hypothetical protein ACRD2X_16235 [Vicinamibacteraceae bacterium]
MPFLRILRDKRGIEHLSLYQPGRDGRPRVLYWFRSSSAAKSGGRAPLDEAARREIERQFPDITFDWQALWQTATTATLPELSPPRAVGAAAEGAQGSRGPVDRPDRSDRSERALEGVEPPGPEQERAQRRRSGRARRRPRSARRQTAVEVSPASEVSE